MLCAGTYVDPGNAIREVPILVDQYGRPIVILGDALALERNRGTANAFGVAIGEWRYDVFNPRAASTGNTKGAAGSVGTTEVLLSSAPALVGGVYFQDDSAAGQALLRDAIVAGSNVAAMSFGVDKDFNGLKFNNGLCICGTATGVSFVCKWRPQ